MYRKTPPCPGNPEDYTFVKSKERYHWRKKRGTVKPAVLNAAFQANADATKILSPVAKMVMGALKAYLNGITTGRLNARIGKALRKSLKEKGEMRLYYLKGIELQRDHPLDGLLCTGYTLRRDKENIFIDIPISAMTIKPLNRLVSHYYFEAVLLCGSVQQEAFRTESVESALYDIKSEEKALCTLQLSLPEEEDWCLLMKITSLEGNEMAAHTKHYRMKVVDGKPLVKN